MKLKIYTSKIYKNKEKIFIEANKEISDTLKSIITKKDEWIIDFIFKITAYNIFFSSTTRSIYLKKTSEVLGKKHKNIVDFIIDEDLIDQKIIEKSKDNIRKVFSSSIKDEITNQKIINLLLDRRLSLIQQNDSTSLEEDYKENALPKYNIEKNYIAKKFLSKYNLNKTSSVQVVYELFEIILLIANSDSLSYKKIEALKFLERFILKYYPAFIRDIKSKSKLPTLKELRQKSTFPVNSICHQCKKRLDNKTNSLFCSKNENRSCYELRLKNNHNKLSSKEKKAISVTSRTKNLCDNCGRLSSLNNLSNIAGISHQFCSSKCKETFRKRKQRANK
ncbi:MAG: hypothetical protein PF572_04195 [Patescibacteria group bacterium]|jgi:sulfur relay (sulfurtransferase) DsrF/TusC family protein|nr:hypothetical protein [Patescibacteria group bacterium]